MRHWVCGWSISHARILVTICNSHRRTSRIVIPNNLKGDRIRFRFSNLYGNHLARIGNARFALCNEQGEIDVQTDRELIVGGKTRFSVPPRTEIYSDEIPFPLNPGQHLAVSLYFPSHRRPPSGNELRGQTLRSVPGNFCSAGVLPIEEDVNVPKPIVEIVPDAQISVTPILSGMDVYTESEPRVIAAFGDSITQQSTWTRPLAFRLYETYPGRVSLSNHGIGGNRLLHDTTALYGDLFGDAGVHRFSHDILSIPGLTHVIFALGTNDIGLPGEIGVPREQLPTFEEYCAALTDLVSALHEQGVKAFGTTILPRVLAKAYDGEREALRRRINEWALTTDIFDRVLDFDSYARRPDGVTGLVPAYDCGDGLHLSNEGGAAIAENIDISWFME